MQILIELGALFVASLIFFIVFERFINNVIVSSSEFFSRFIDAYKRMKFARYAPCLLIGAIIAGYWYLVVEPIRIAINNNLMLTYGFPISSNTLNMLLGSQVVFTLFVLIIYFVFSWTKTRLSAKVIIVITGSILTIYFILAAGQKPDKSEATIVTSNKSILESLLALDDNRINILSFPVELSDSENLDILIKHIHRSMDKSMAQPCMLSASLTSGKNNRLSLIGRTTTFRYVDSIVTDTEYFSMDSKTVNEITSEFRDKIYECISLPPGGHDFGLIISHNRDAFLNFIGGIERLNEYSRGGLTEALSYFDRAIIYDSSYVAAYIYKAYALCLLTDRRWQSISQSDEEFLPASIFADSVSNYLQLAVKIARSENDLGSGKFMVEDSFLLTRTLGLFYQTYAGTYMDYYMGEHSESSLDIHLSLDLAERYYNRARSEYIKAINMNPRAYKIANNLAGVYLNLHKIYLLQADSTKAYDYLIYAGRAIDEAILNNPFESGYLINRANISILLYRSFEQDNQNLLAEAKSKIFKGINETQEKYWKGFGYYNLACLLSIQGDIASAKENLCKAAELNAFNIGYFAKYDEDLKNLREDMGEARFEEFMEKCISRSEALVDKDDIIM